MNSLSVSNTYLRNLCCASPVHKNSVTLVGHLQQRGLHPHAYLDDWLMWYQSSQKLNVKQQYIIKHTLRFWFLVNWEKSSFNPETRFSRCFYRSGKWHDFSCLRTLPKFESMIYLTQISEKIQVRTFLRLFEIWNSCIDLVPLARLHMKPIKMHLLFYYKLK